MSKRITALIITVSTATGRDYSVSSIQAVDGVVEQGTGERYHSLTEGEARQLFEDLAYCRWPGYEQPTPDQPHFDLWT